MNREYKAILKKFTGGQTLEETEDLLEEVLTILDDNQKESIQTLLKQALYLEAYKGMSENIKLLIEGQLELEKVRKTQVTGLLPLIDIHKKLKQETPISFNVIVDSLLSHVGQELIASISEVGETYYKVTNRQDKTVSLVTVENFKSSIKNSFRKGVLPDRITPKISNNWIEAFERNIDRLEDLPATTARLDEDLWCLHKCKYKPIRGDCPTFDFYLDLHLDPQAVMAFIYGVWAQVYKGRQALVTVSKGDNGKSTFADFIGIELFGGISSGSVGAFNDDSMRTSDGNGRWLAAALHGKRLLLNTESSYPYLINNPRFKQFNSGGADTVLIEEKNKPTFSGYIKGNYWLARNVPLLLTNRKEERSRILYTTVEPFPDGYIKSDKVFDNMRLEMNAFLYKCKEAYEDRCKDNRVIVQNSKSMTLINSLTEQLFADFADFFTDNYKQCKESSVRASLVKKEFIEEMGKYKLDSKALGASWDTFENDYLPTVGVEKKKNGSGRGLIFRGMCEIGKVNGTAGER